MIPDTAWSRSWNHSRYITWKIKFRRYLKPVLDVSIFYSFRSIPKNWKRLKIYLSKKILEIDHRENYNNQMKHFVLILSFYLITFFGIFIDFLPLLRSLSYTHSKIEKWFSYRLYGATITHGFKGRYVLLIGGEIKKQKKGWRQESACMVAFCGIFIRFRATLRRNESLIDCWRKIHFHNFLLI